MPKPSSFREIAFWKARDFMMHLFYYSVPSIFTSLFYKCANNHEHAFHFLVFIVACRLCYSKSARDVSRDVCDLFGYFHSQLQTLYDDSMYSINMHQLLHVGDQIERWGALPFCSMFTFEHQFQNFKLYTYGRTSFLKLYQTGF